MYILTYKSMHVCYGRELIVSRVHYSGVRLYIYIVSFNAADITFAALDSM